MKSGVSAGEGETAEEVAESDVVVAATGTPTPGAGLSQLNASRLLPTYSGARDWLRRHREEIDTVAHLLETYPNLLLEDEMEAFRKRLLLKPPQNPARESRHRKLAWQRAADHRPHRPPSGPPEELGAGGDSRPSSGDELGLVADEFYEGGGLAKRSPVNSVFVCASYALSISECAVMERVVSALTPFCFVRCCLPESMEDSYTADYYDSIVGCDAFVFILNGKTLRSTFALHHLAVAVTYQVPVIMVRGPRFSLPRPIFGELSGSGLFSDGEQASPPSSIRDTPRGHSSSDLTLKRAADEARQDTARSCRSLPTDRERVMAQIQFMTKFIEQGYRESIVYSDNYHDASIGKLFGRLSEYLGDAFLDFEVFRSNVAGLGQASRSGVAPLPPLKNGIMQNSAANNNKPSSSAEFYASRPKRVVSSQTDSLNSAPSDGQKRSSPANFKVQGSAVRHGQDRQKASPDYGRKPRNSWTTQSPVIHPTRYLVFPAKKSTPTSTPYTFRFSSNKFEQQDSGYAGSPPSPLSSSSDSLFSSPYDFGQIQLDFLYRSTDSTPIMAPETKRIEKARRQSSARLKSAAAAASPSASKTSTPDSALSRTNQPIKKIPSKVDMTSLMNSITNAKEASDPTPFSSRVNLPKKQGAKETKKITSRNTRTTVVGKMRPKISLKVATVTLRYNL